MGKSKEQACALALELKGSSTSSSSSVPPAHTQPPSLPPAAPLLTAESVDQLTGDFRVMLLKPQSLVCFYFLFVFLFSVFHICNGLAHKFFEVN